MGDSFHTTGDHEACDRAQAAAERGEDNVA